ncbi:hypothetical protein G3480_25615 [Thiorhodococcus mannitoliphagus]|uniref:Uncharacterized protein n=1 Tax=Thiorhodococcus mannitoliphagus TaxID=329406 RepID=A0A6P1E502_9GAMM|nr:hypothetical protein [Thiorhodococcus mannitoliphagus]NEX23612.1 hypothetical protein [Thiorhodococcus mannitoliphagus]
MKVALLVALLVAAAHAVAQNADPEWVLAGETRKPYLSCNQPKDNGYQLNWTRPVVDGSGSQGIGSEGEIDGRVLYEGNESMSVVEWTKPIHDRRIGKLVMHLSASDMRRRSTLRVQTSISNGGSQYGGVYSVYASPPSSSASGPAGTLISSVVNVDRYQDFDLKVSITNGGNCYEEPVIYHFRRVR